MTAGAARTHWWRRPGLALVGSAAAVWLLARIVFGTGAPIIHVVWSDIGSHAREYLERRFSLSDGHELVPGTWAYALRDTSPGTRRALVTHHAVERVAGIDPQSFELAAGLARAPMRRGPIPVPDRLARTVNIVAILTALAGLAQLWLGPTVFAWFLRGIPEASPKAAAAFRIVFGSAVVAFFVSQRVTPELLTPLLLAEAGGPYGATVRWLGDHPVVVTSMRAALAVTGALFVAGVATRVSFACFTAVALLWSVVFTLRISAHAIAALVMALLALVAAPWGDAWSVDAWLRRRRGHEAPAPGRAYGYAFWVPAFVLGVAFAAAAWSKLHQGPAWILNGTVKYHFVSDLDDALVSWGPAMMRWHAVAVAMTAFAVLTEALLITSMFSRSYRYRATLGVMSTILFAGFAVFQGVVWVGWWVLLLAFLPWHLIAGPGNDPTPRLGGGRIPAVQRAAIVLLIGQQVVASATRFEGRPLVSAYDMYAATYRSPEEYEAASNLIYRVVAVVDGRSTDLPGCVVDDRVAAVARRVLGGSAQDRQLLHLALEDCLRSVPWVRQVALEGDRRVFVWEESRFAWKRGLDVIGPIEAALLRE